MRQLILGTLLGSVVWNGPTPMHQLGGQCGAEKTCLGTASVVRQITGTDGGPQALEGYTTVDTRGSVRLAMGTIGNVEQAGSGDIVEVRPLQSGGVVTGTGRIHRWTALVLDKPKKMGGQPVSPEQLIDYRAIQFANGLHLRAEIDPRDGKPYLALCPDDVRSGPCQMFKP